MFFKIKKSKALIPKFSMKNESKFVNLGKIEIFYTDFHYNQFNIA